MYVLFIIKTKVLKANNACSFKLYMDVTSKYFHLFLIQKLVQIFFMFYNPFISVFSKNYRNLYFIFNKKYLIAVVFTYHLENINVSFKILLHPFHQTTR